jgi:hypothetical protein
VAAQNPKDGKQAINDKKWELRLIYSHDLKAFTIEELVN